MYSKLSDKKTTYLQKDKQPFTFSGQDLRHIAAYYTKKNIIIHAETYQEGLRILSKPRKAINEIKAIQQKLNDDEYVGYLYTNNARDHQNEHFEAFIIGKNHIIKPIMWNCNDHQLLNVDGAACPTTIAFNSHIDDKKTNLIPQAGGSECGPLSISHLKNYLINDATQLKEFTLNIPFYEPNKKKPAYFFLPSPQVLRYSQTELYNQFIEALVTGETITPQVITYKKHTLAFETLQATLDKTIAQANRLEAHDVVNEARKILENLPCFREKWLNEYQIIKQKRDKMHCNTKNMYLTYTCQRMKIISLNEEQQYNSISTLLRDYLTLLVTQDIERLLQKDLAKINFKNSEVICNFLRKIDPAFYPTALLAINNFPTELDELSAASNFLLTKIQLQALIEAIKWPDNFNKIVLQLKPSSSDFSLQNQIPTVTFAAILDWLIFLKVPKNQLIDFLDKHISSNWLSEHFQQTLLTDYASLYECKKILDDYEGDAYDGLFNQIVLKYVTENCLISNAEAIIFKKKVCDSPEKTMEKKELINTDDRMNEDTNQPKHHNYPFDKQYPGLFNKKTNNKAFMTEQINSISPYRM